MTEKVLTAKGQLRKKRLMNAALEIFEEKGYRDASIDDIVRADSTGKGTFYWYWKSKDELFLDLLKEKFENYLGALESVGRMNSPAPDKLMLLIAEIARILVKYRKFCKLVFLMISENSNNFSADVTTVTQDYYRRFREILTQIVLDGQQSGHIHTDIDAEYLATLLISIVDGVIVQEKVMSVNFELPKLGDVLLTILRKGVLIAPTG